MKHGHSRSFFRLKLLKKRLPARKKKLRVKLQTWVEESGRIKSISTKSTRTILRRNYACCVWRGKGGRCTVYQAESGFYAFSGTLTRRNVIGNSSWQASVLWRTQGTQFEEATKLEEVPWDLFLLTSLKPLLSSLLFLILVHLAESIYLKKCTA